MIAVRSKIYKFRTIGSNEGNIMYWEKVSTPGTHVQNNS